jgi:hypothetical protein
MCATGLLACQGEVNPPRRPRFSLLHEVEGKIPWNNGPPDEATEKGLQQELDETLDRGTVVCAFLHLLQQAHDLRVGCREDLATELLLDVPQEALLILTDEGVDELDRLVHPAE